MQDITAHNLSQTERDTLLYALAEHRQNLKKQRRDLTEYLRHTVAELESIDRELDGLEETERSLRGDE